MTATIELKHANTRTGIIVEARGVDSQPKLRTLASNAIWQAARTPTRDVTDPGFWAIMVGHAALRLGGASIQRVASRADLHATFFVERGSMLADFPEWPMVKLTEAGEPMDLRGPEALACGPSDAALVAYRETLDVSRWGSLAVHDLRRMFDTGVLQWAADCKPGKRWAVVRAQA